MMAAKLMGTEQPTLSPGPHPLGHAQAGMSAAETEGAGGWSGACLGAAVSLSFTKPSLRGDRQGCLAKDVVFAYCQPGRDLLAAAGVHALAKWYWEELSKDREVPQSARLGQRQIFGPMSLENCTILQRVWRTYCKKEEGGGVSTMSAARVGFDAKNHCNKSTNETKCNRHPRVANAQLIGQDT